MASSNPRQDQSVDIAIITIRDDEEKAVLKRLIGHVPDRRGNQIYATGTVQTAEQIPQSLSVAVARCARAGPIAAQSLANDIITDLCPRVIFVVGIAAGFPVDEVSLGDVVLATHVSDLCVKAMVDGKPPEHDVAGGPIQKEVEVVLTALNRIGALLGDWNSNDSIGLTQPSVDLSSDRFYGPEAWKERLGKILETRFSPTGDKIRPSKHSTGPFVSSSDLIKSVSVVEGWLDMVRKAVGCEMEMAGVFEAARKVGHTYPVCGVRGISDIVGFKRNECWTAYACEAAAAFAFALIKTGLIPYRQEIHEGGLSANVIAKSKPKGKRSTSPTSSMRRQGSHLSASSAEEEGRAFQSASDFVDRGDTESAVQVMLSGQKFEDVNSSAQLSVIVAYQKSGHVEKAQHCIDTFLSERNAPSLTDRDRALGEMFALKLNSQRGDVVKVRVSYRAILRRLEKARLIYKMSSVYRRAAIALAVLGQSSQAKRCLDDARSHDDPEDPHSKITTRVYQAICMAFGKVPVADEDPLNVVRTAPKVYLSSEIKREHHQANPLKSAVMCLFSEAAILMHGRGHSGEGWLYLTAAHLLGRSCGGRPQAEGYAELLSLLRSEAIQEPVRFAMYSDDEGHGEFLRKYPQIGRHLRACQRLPQIVRADDPASWGNARKVLESLALNF